MQHVASPYDAILIVSFGGPEGLDDVLPFLENVLRGRRVPRERMLEVAGHYQSFGGISPINQQVRELIDALRDELDQYGPKLPIYWGNRNWHPLLADTMQEMADAGVRRALALLTSAYSSYSGCRQYLEDIERAREIVGPAAPQIDRIRAFYNHPGFIEPMVERVAEALKQIPPDRRGAAPLIFTAHSIPLAMAAGCQYEAQLQEACRLVSEAVGRDTWHLVYQSRSGRPSQPWLEPDICDFLRDLPSTTSSRATDVVVSPIGFLSDHLEVLYDLDTEARQVCEQLGINMIRAATVGNHPRLIQMIRELIVERISDQPQRPALGHAGPAHDVCPADCCRSGTEGRSDGERDRPDPRA